MFYRQFLHYTFLLCLSFFLVGCSDLEKVIKEKTYTSKPGKTINLEGYQVIEKDFEVSKTETPKEQSEIERIMEGLEIVDSDFEISLNELIKNDDSEFGKVSLQKVDSGYNLSRSKNIGAVIDGKNFSLEVARTAKEREKGLMFRENLAEDAGMIFV